MFDGFKRFSFTNTYKKLKALFSDQLISNVRKLRFKEKSAVDKKNDIEQWFHSSVGEKLLHQERECLDRLLPSMFGYHLMQLSSVADANLYDKSVIRHCFSLSPMPVEKEAETDDSIKPSTLASYEQLPIDNESIDVVLLHHVLEYSPQPHLLLREATRSLIPNGHILLIGFNPFSLMEIFKCFARVFSSSARWQHHSFRIGRLKDWFKVLELDLVETHHGFFDFPHKRLSSRWFDKLGQRIAPIFGGFYILVLRKNAASMIIAKQKWNKQKHVSSWGKNIVTPSVPSSVSSIVQEEAGSGYFGTMNEK